MVSNCLEVSQCPDGVVPGLMATWMKRNGREMSIDQVQGCIKEGCHRPLGVLPPNSRSHFLISFCLIQMLLATRHTASHYLSNAQR